MKNLEINSTISFEGKNYKVILDEFGNVWYCDPNNSNVKNNLGQFNKYKIEKIEDAKNVVLKMLKIKFLRQL